MFRNFRSAKEQAASDSFALASKPAGPYDLADLSAADKRIVERIAPFTMTSHERCASLLGAVDHIHRHRIPGDIVECGVWRGGSMMACALSLLGRGDAQRRLHLYDTFEGMSAPMDVDKSFDGEAAEDQLRRNSRSHGIWCEASIEDVQANLESTGYPRERMHFVKGKVEDTIPARIPDEIALLRLDTDWYSSTLHELNHLYPRLAKHGILIIDDYGHWQGARQAVDEYFKDAGPSVYLHRIDYTGRMVLKP